jgi:hypothetical protein
MQFMASEPVLENENDTFVTDSKKYSEKTFRCCELMNKYRIKPFYHYDSSYTEYILHRELYRLYHISLAYNVRNDNDGIEAYIDTSEYE